MYQYRPPETGTLIMAAYLLLSLGFAGYWIVAYAQGGKAPWELMPWFGAGVVLIAVVGMLAYFVRGRREEP